MPPAEKKQGRVERKDGSRVEKMTDLVFERRPIPHAGVCSCCQTAQVPDEPGTLVRSPSSKSWHWFCATCTRAVVDAYRSAS